jgi:bleomycin hydrolase
MKILVILISILILSINLLAQNLESKIPALIDKIEKPGSIESFKPIFHFPPVNQDTTYVCWSFSTLSFIETESKRLGNQPVKLSMMFPVYYGFIEKAKLFVQTHGQSRFTPGDLFITVFDVIKTHGMVPLDAYKGQTRNCKTFNHDALYSELNVYINNVKKEQNWQEDHVIAGLKVILNKHLGPPPRQFNYDGKEYTPTSFAAEYVNLPWDDYMLVTTFMYDQFDSYIVLNVPDNWKKTDRFFNVTLDEFYDGIKESLLNGYSLAIDGDIGEPGRYGPLDVAIIPDYDIPFTAVSQEAREYRFQEGNTTDDHLMHIVGYQEINGVDWFLIKDSWRDAWEGKEKGYFLYREDFVKLKVLAYLVHKDAIPNIRQKLPK